MPRNLRVAAAQFATGVDVGANLDTALRMATAAADEGAQLVVLPEFCNHLSVYDDASHAWRVAVDLDGEWIDAFGSLAASRGVWIQFNVTLRRTPATAGGARPVITNSNIVVAADGSVAGVTDKTVLMGAEGEHLTPASTAPPSIDSPFGRLGSYACMDGIVPEVPRVAAASGARVLMNSLNSFALDEASLHIPVRAAENRAWVVACCKVGPLLPGDKLAVFSGQMGVPRHMLEGAGESQVVAPDGVVVAKGPRTGEAVVVADIDLDRGGQPRPDGTDPWSARRPKLYAPLAARTPELDDHQRADELTVAVASAAEQLADAIAAGAQLVVLPELAVTVDDMANVADVLQGTDAVVVTSVRDGDAHVGVVIGSGGVLLRQRQLHQSERRPWSTSLGEAVELLDLEWGRLAVIVGDDLIYPEVARLAALESADVLAVPLDAQEPWETTLGVPERAAENRVCVVAATSPASAGAGVIADLPADFTLWAPSRERPFDGTINAPDLTLAGADGCATGVIHPSRAVQRQISKGTNLVDGRPWSVCAALVDGRRG